MRIYAVIVEVPDVLKHLRPKKSLKLFLGRYQNHSKPGFFYENHQPEVMQRLKMNDQSS